ncbi:hypothetical protein GQ55_9G141900 [Panicum hallii var. hallii]|uniref:WRKY domain-containing protein n=1 Tax=Panicum hallii var. hallii TaxID=1504633 RepID=A0A2T7C383_9POAL|nr:hypothetical protein GQ55_9G141900 [Panicum hallii var. hallii]
MASSSSSQPNAMVGNLSWLRFSCMVRHWFFKFSCSNMERGRAGDRNQEKEDEAVVAAAAVAEAGNGSQLVMPEDGYEWKKSYFRCRHRLCGAKKKVEWHPSDPSGALRVVYEGAHQHGSPPSSSAAAAGGASNKYELGAQYFGGARPQ